MKYTNSFFLLITMLVALSAKTMAEIGDDRELSELDLDAPELDDMDLANIELEHEEMEAEFEHDNRMLRELELELELQDDEDFEFDDEELDDMELEFDYNHHGHRVLKKTSEVAICEGKQHKAGEAKKKAQRTAKRQAQFEKQLANAEKKADARAKKAAKKEEREAAKKEKAELRKKRAEAKKARLAAQAEAKKQAKIEKAEQTKAKKAKAKAKKAAARKKALEKKAAQKSKAAAAKLKAKQKKAKKAAAAKKKKAAAKAKKAAKAAKKAAAKQAAKEKRAAEKIKKAEEKAKKALERAAAKEKKAAEKAAKKEERDAARAAAQAARKEAREAKKAAKKAARQARRAAKKLKAKLARKNRRKRKAAKKDLDIIGGKCVADHWCASVRGDPHMTTFDGLKYDCQGNGEFILVKSMETSFEIQGRFEKTGRKDKSVSITKAISIDPGTDEAPQIDLFTEEVGGECIINYYVDGALANWGMDGKAYTGLEFMEDIDAGKEVVDFLYFTGSGVMYTVLVKKGKFGCVLNSKICLPPDMVKEQTIIGILGTPNNNKADDWMSSYGTDLVHGGKTKWGPAYEYCTREWCVHNEEDSIFGYLNGTTWEDFYGCADNYDPSAEKLVESASDECKACCAPLTGEDENEACLLECVEGGVDDCKIEIDTEEVLLDVESKCPDSGTAPPIDEPEPEPEEKEEESDSDDEEEEEEEESDSDDEDPKLAPPKETESEDETQDRTITPPSPKKGSSSGDPHFKTWTGDKYDYHGECDLVLVDHPKFYNGLGLKVHIRTTRVKYFSFIEIVTVQIGEDVLEFDNDIENFLINGATVDENRAHHKTYLSGFVVNRNNKALSIRLLDDEQRGTKGNPKIDLHTRKNGFPAVIVDGGHTDIFKGSLGLLGDWETGKRLARDGVTEMNDEDPTAFALEWQVRDTERVLFSEERFPQYPDSCSPPAKMPAGRLGMDMARKEAEEACGHWEEDMDDCIFDVIATKDILVAQEGHIVHIE